MIDPILHKAQTSALDKATVPLSSSHKALHKVRSEAPVHSPSLAKMSLSREPSLGEETQHSTQQQAAAYCLDSSAGEVMAMDFDGKGKQVVFHPVALFLLFVGIFL